MKENIVILILWITIFMVFIHTMVKHRRFPAYFYQTGAAGATGAASERGEIHKSASSSQYEWQMYKWRESFLSGNFSSNIQIAVKVFGKQAPVRKLKEEHSYPFLTMDTLAVWADWTFEISSRKVGD